MQHAAVLLCMPNLTYTLSCCCAVTLQGLRVGVSSRGWASLVRHPVTQQLVVDDDFQLITFDFVPDPSNSGAFLYPMPRRYR